LNDLYAQTHSNKQIKDLKTTMSIIA